MFPYHFACRASLLACSFILIQASFFNGSVSMELTVMVLKRRMDSGLAEEFRGCFYMWYSSFFTLFFSFLVLRMFRSCRSYVIVANYYFLCICPPGLRLVLRRTTMWREGFWITKIMIASSAHASNSLRYI